MSEHNDPLAGDDSAPMQVAQGSDLRRLSDKIIRAFTVAEQQNDLPVASLLSQALEICVTQDAALGYQERREEIDKMMDVHRRLLVLKTRLG